MISNLVPLDICLYIMFYCGGLFKMVVEEAIDIIKNLDGAVEVQELSEEDKEALNKIESNRNNDIIPVVNRGLSRMFKKRLLFSLT